MPSRTGVPPALAARTVNEHITIVGLDVHKATVVAAILPPAAARPTRTATIENCPEAIERLVRRVAGDGRVVFVQEAGPCGYQVHRQMTEMGRQCVVVAPGLTPVRPGDRVKTDRRDAEKLARLYRAGELTEIYVPTCVEEAARDLVRMREDTLEDRLRARHRLSKFLLRQGRVYRETKAWGVAHRAWLRRQCFEWTSLADDRWTSTGRQLTKHCNRPSRGTCVPSKRLRRAWRVWSSKCWISPRPVLTGRPSATCAA